MKHKILFLPVVLTSAIVSQAEVPIACNLNALTPGQRLELKHFSDRVAHTVIGTREMDDGYGFQLNSASISAVDVAQGIEVWRKCCPFYEFRIDLSGEDGALWLSLRGRKGVKEYFPIDAPQLAAKLPRHGSR
jgi:hypothetical protein